MHKGEEVEFELFDEYETRRERIAAPTVSVRKNSTLMLNRAAWEGLGSPQYVRLYYARDEEIVGIRPAPTKARNTLKVTIAASHCDISGRGYLRHFGIPHNATKRYLANIESDGEGPLLSFSLKDEPVWVGKKSADDKGEQPGKGQHLSAV